MGAIEVHKVVRDRSAEHADPRAVVHRLLVRPIADATRTIDVSDALTKAVAHRLWEQTGGNDALNWLEAERLVQELLLRLSECDLPASAEVRCDVADEDAPKSRKASLMIEPKADVAGRIEPPADDETSAPEAVPQAA